MMWPYGNGYGMMGGFGGYGGWGFGIAHSLIWLVIAGLIIWALFSFVRSGSGQSGGGASRRSAGLDILEERYARGEVNREEYLQKKRDMTG